MRATHSPCGVDVFGVQIDNSWANRWNKNSLLLFLFNYVYLFLATLQPLLAGVEYSEDEKKGPRPLETASQ